LLASQECPVRAFVNVTALVGRSPLRYHNEWRLTLARAFWPSAARGSASLSIGYESEAAFSRAYKGLFGHSPRDEFKLRNGIGV
jgi:transcriptional regulator GlxA family with amidase domain